MDLAMVSLALGTAAATLSHAPRLVAATAAAGQTCAVMQAAYTAALPAGTKRIHPREVRSEPRALELDKFVPEYRARLALSAKEFDELAIQAQHHAASKIKPDCRWNGSPSDSIDDEGHPAFVTFTDPIFSGNGRLAILQVSFREDGPFGYGLVCVVRQRRKVWRGQCQNSWIT